MGLFEFILGCVELLEFHAFGDILGHYLPPVIFVVVVLFFLWDLHYTRWYTSWCFTGVSQALFIFLYSFFSLSLSFFSLDWRISIDISSSFSDSSFCQLEPRVMLL